MLALACSSMIVNRRYRPSLPSSRVPFITRPRSCGLSGSFAWYGLGKLAAARVLTPAVEADEPNGRTSPPPTTIAPPRSSSRRLRLIAHLPAGQW
jgi:hypothetical protein